LKCKKYNLVVPVPIKKTDRPAAYVVGHIARNKSLTAYHSAVDENKGIGPG